MVHITLNPFHKYFCMFYIHHKSSRDYIWSQLGLRYMVKQIYDKHMAIQWAQVNAKEPMIRDDFIML
jgi:hypothetical protein